MKCCVSSSLRGVALESISSLKFISSKKGSKCSNDHENGRAEIDRRPLCRWMMDELIIHDKMCKCHFVDIFSVCFSATGVPVRVDSSTHVQFYFFITSRAKMS